MRRPIRCPTLTAALLLVPLIAAAAPGSPATPKSPATLHDALTAELGPAVAILAADDGLHAWSADGARSRRLVEGRLLWAVADPRGQAIWYGAEGAKKTQQVHLLDVMTAGAEPTLVLAGAPADIAVGIRYPAPPGEKYPETLSYEESYDGMLLLSLEKASPRLEYLAGLEGTLDPESAKKSRRRAMKATIRKAARPVLGQIARRGQDGRLFAEPGPAKSMPRIESVPLADCMDGSRTLR